MLQVTHPQPRQSSRARLVRRVLLFAAIGAVGMFASLTYFWFVNPSTQTVETVNQADAVVVFVGSEDRIDKAVSLVRQGAAPNLVIPNGDDVAEELCAEDSLQVFCPPSDTIDTEGEARTIGGLARDMGWSSLIAVTSQYHVHRASYQLALCHDGPIQTVVAERELDRDDLIESLVHEWAGTLAAMTIQRAC